MQEMPTLTMNLSGIMGDVGSALKLVDTKTATNLILTVEVHFILSVSLTANKNTQFQKFRRKKSS